MHYVAPTTPGHYRVALSGSPRRVPFRAQPRHPSGALVEATVPRHAVIAIVVVRHAVGGQHASRGTRGTTADTGVDAATPLLLGLGLVACGVVLLLVGLRRRAPDVIAHLRRASGA
jgi:hypothetical protein